MTIQEQSQPVGDPVQHCLRGGQQKKRGNQATCSLPAMEPRDWRSDPSGSDFNRSVAPDDGKS